ncbi:MAG: glycosyltransferase, partial [Verrucomicrobiota bacterium]|nr:glycosyltransferase [Verrucomicrobiota bacterium]
MNSGNKREVTVITPTFNRSSELKEALASVLKQSLPPKEHIICDNCSEDETEAVVKAYADEAPYRVIYKRERDTGIYQAMNRGLATANGEFLFILNDDDQFHGPTVLDRFSACLSGSGAEFIFGDTVWLDRNTGEKKYRRHNQMNRLTLVQKGISQQAILYRKSAF